MAQGIKFEEGLSWEQVKQKAKVENKFIFVDAYATWCVPCKLMDKEVYPDDSLGFFMNNKFISLKVQMDTTKNDNAYIQKWYSSAHNIQLQYKVTAFPTFLFLDSEGKIVHRYSGSLTKEDFLRVATNSMNPDKQFYTLLQNYLNGKKEYLRMPYLVRMTKDIGEVDLSNEIRSDYLVNYLFKLDDQNLYSIDNIIFIRESIFKSSDKAFKFFNENQKLIDSVMSSKAYARNIIDFIITKENVDPVVNAALAGKQLPSWSQIRKKIKRKYDVNLADRVVLHAKTRWYRAKKEWHAWGRSYVKQVEQYGPESNNYNDAAWTVFNLSSDTFALAKALKWADVALQQSPDNPAFIDTKANVLYKLGRREDAIYWEEKAVRLSEAPGNQFAAFAKIFKETVEKIKKGQPTWPLIK